QGRVRMEGHIELQPQAEYGGDLVEVEVLRFLFYQYMLSPFICFTIITHTVILLFISFVVNRK
nr:hypothetical protein [Butyrivibrio sp.]